ncbi:DUF2213 domain-containing protein [Allorhizobium ampelinum]|uniref:DUF2213 domain-containing protein n=1 Tax=Allorhizobium ampelinum TaxID=3025782 RepID=UPI0013037192|nr:DUF2213 domain-containing protein [Allorhizobium ampelinum]NTA27407.1 DUF2213 domain-containing protein [Allorhizobium ampelinum]
MGIPSSVGKEFIAKDEQKQAAGILFVAPDGNVLVLLRSGDEANFASHWSLPGGGVDPDETAEEGAAREAVEEMGNVPVGKLRVIGTNETPTGMLFTTFGCAVKNKFAPTLNWEHVGYAWVSLDRLPMPVHPGVLSTLSDWLGISEDMKPDDWQAAKDILSEWASEGHNEPEVASDKLPDGMYAKGRRALAFDRASVRSFDQDGRMKVERSNISKATVSPYYGREIVGWQELGLDANKLYKLFRDPDELEKAKDTFNSLPILSEHVPVSAASPRKDIIIGSSGTDAAFDGTYLTNSLVFWDGKAIEDILEEEAKELSCAYHYTPDMTPGEYEGEAYDGRMTNIRGNHIALVPQGRAGPDVYVADSAPQRFEGEHTGPKLGKSKQNEVLTMAKIPARDAAVVKRALTALKPQLAQDADLDDVLELIEAVVSSESPDISEDEGDIHAFLKSKLSDEDYAQACELMKPAMDEDDDKEEDKKDMAKDEEEVPVKPDMVSKPAMDAAIAAAVERTAKNMAAARAAEKAVRPYVGELSVAMDSAEGVYKTALEMMGVKTKGIHPSAYEAILMSQPVPGAAQKKTHVAMDAKAKDDFASRFPGVRQIKTI